MWVEREGEVSADVEEEEEYMDEEEEEDEDIWGTVETWEIVNVEVIPEV